MLESTASTDGGKHRQDTYTGVVPRYDLPNAAPEPLRAIQRFVNTVDLEHEREWLATPRDLANLLAELGLDPGTEPTPGDLRRARAFREAMRALLRGHTERAAPSSAAVAVVNDVARQGALTPEFDDVGLLRLVPRRSGVPGALAGLVAIAASAEPDGTFGRLKACRKCGFVFYDYSRSRTAGWCSMAICGNRLKTRRYRERLAARRAGSDR